MNLKAGVTAVAFGVAAVFVSGSLPTQVFAAPASVLKTVDTDNDGTVDLNEAKAAAEMAESLSDSHLAEEALSE